MKAQTLANSPDNASPLQGQDWRADLRTAYRSGAAVLQALNLDSGKVCEQSAKDFPCLVTQSYLDCMQPGDPDDPLLRQILPIAQEQAQVAGFGCDPVGESQFQAAPGLLQKYQSRALLVCTGGCAIHCRYCFRRHYDYQQTERGPRWWQAALDQIADDQAIDEVILSGGDPLLLPSAQLAELMHAICEIPQIKRIRIHSRIPVVLPSRMNDSLLAVLVNLPLPVVLVIHANHANEISDHVCVGLKRFRSNGVHILNQSVLLAGVNDSSAAMVDLSHALFAADVLPYYIHVLDPVAGAAHFLVPDEEAVAIMREAQKTLPGYLLPRLVREVPGAASKQLIAF